MALTLRDCVVLHGPQLRPHRCKLLRVEADTITALELGEPCNALETGALLVMPGMVNAHTHVGDSCLPDGATGLSLEQGFFRPDGYKYRELARQSRPAHLAHISSHLRYMARCGTVAHIDFREQGVHGTELLREAARATGMLSVILGQFDQPPFTQAQLDGNIEGLGESAQTELAALLASADGFSESTMNDLTDTAWRQIHEATAQANKLRAIHVLENAGYRETSMARTGHGDLAQALALYDPHLLIHGTVANEAEIALLSEGRRNLALNPRANASLGLPAPPIAALLQSQTNLLLGTDNVMLNSPNMLAELDYTYKLAKSQFGNAIDPDPARILAMATVNAQAVLGGDYHGYLAVGLPADLVVLDFYAPQLRATRHLVASLVGRVTPEEVLLTLRQGRALYASTQAQAWLS